MIILASEDIGMANPNALLLANATMDSCVKTGYPEARIMMAQCAVYLACSPKSNSSYSAIDQALAYVKDHPNEPIPLHLRNAPTKLMKDLGYGSNYEYSHDYENNHSGQEFLPETAKNTTFYIPQGNPSEQKLKEHLHKLWKGKYGY